MDTPFLGMICLFPRHRIPHGWMACDGQILSIAQNQALFSILGASYGGNGASTFAIPRIKPITCCDNAEGAEKTIPREMQYVYCIAVQGMYPMPD